MVAAVQTQQLSKRYGPTVALEHLDLEIESGTVFGYLGPNGAGKSTTIALLLGLIRPTAGAAQIFGFDVVRDALAIHRRLAYVPSEANLWPSLTGAEVLRVPRRDPRLGRRRVPRRARRALRPHARPQGPRLQPRQPPEGAPDRRLRQPRRAARVRRADHRARSAHGAGLPDVCARSPRPRTDGVPVVAHLERGRCRVRPGRDAARRTDHRDRRSGIDPRLASVRVRATFTGAVPDLSGVEGVAEVAVDDHTVECDVTGSMQPLMTVLAAGGRHPGPDA